jgi:RNA polymerase sigma-70 factor (ECF subfamily)
MNDGRADPELALGDVAWVRNLARSLVRDPLAADDLAQETWLVALRASRRGPRAWLGGVARILARRGSRRIEPRPVGLMEDASARAATPDELLAQADFQRRVLAAVTTLDEPYRTTVLLRHFEGLTVEELSRRMNVPSSTSRTRLQRAHTQLRERLDRDYGERGSWSVLACAASPASLATGAGAWTGAAIMGTQVKIALVCVAAVGVGLWTWREMRESPRRANAEGARSAELVPVAAAPHESAPIDPGAVVQRESAPGAASEATALESVHIDAVANSAPGASPPIVTPLTLLERRLDAVADTFLTEEPDLVGLLSLTAALADAATFEVDEATGLATGKLLVAGNLKGTFSIHEQEYRVELDTEKGSAPFRRTLTLQLTDESRSAHGGMIRVGSFPLKGTFKGDIDHEFVGWRASIDPVEGAKVIRTTMKAEDPSLGPFLSDSYLYETRDAPGFEPREQPGLANTDAFDRWLERLRPLRKP